MTLEEAQEKHKAYLEGKESPLDIENVWFHMHVWPYDIRLIPYEDKLTK